MILTDAADQVGTSRVYGPLSRVKKAVGELTDNADLKREGEIDQASGKVKEVTQKVADKARQAVHKK